jgi:ABC-type Fe3+ transport system substrate-binding protein
VDWLAAGKYAFSIFTTPSRARLDDARQQGLPVHWFEPNQLKEGVGSSTSSGNVGLIQPTPHPNAAKVAINWLLSREGQIAYQRATRGDSRRTDIPKDGVRPSTMRVEGANYVETDSPERRNMEPIRKIVSESWKKGR